MSTGDVPFHGQLSTKARNARRKQNKKKRKLIELSANDINTNEYNDDGVDQIEVNQTASSSSVQVVERGDHLSIQSIDPEDIDRQKRRKLAYAIETSKEWKNQMSPRHLPHLYRLSSTDMERMTDLLSVNRDTENTRIAMLSFLGLSSDDELSGGRKDEQNEILLTSKTVMEGILQNTKTISQEISSTTSRQENDTQERDKDSALQPSAFVHYLDKLNLHAIECDQPYLYKPEIPPYPFERIERRELDTMHVVHSTEHLPIVENIAQIRPGDVLEISYVALDPPSVEPMYVTRIALVYEVHETSIKVRLEKSLIEIYSQPAKYSGCKSTKLDYGDRVIEQYEISSMKVVDTARELPALHFFEYESYDSDYDV